LRNIDQFGTSLAFEELSEHLDTVKASTFHETFIRNDSTVVFVNNSIDSRVRFKKAKAGNYHLIIEAVVYHKEGWKWIEVLKYNIYKSPIGLIEIQNITDTNERFVSPRFSDSVLQEYQQADHDSLYQNNENLGVISSKLFICAINGNDQCIKSFFKLNKKFDMNIRGYITALYLTYFELLNLRVNYAIPTQVNLGSSHH
jgi:hypothetical protein